MWLRGQMPPTDEGKQQWRELVEWWDTPPRAAQAALPPSKRVLRPPGAPPDAPVTPAAEAAAFAAFMGAGRG